MAVSPDENSSAPAHRPGADAPRKPGGVSPRDSGPGPLESISGVDGIVQEIREGLAQISSRELELRRREQEVSRRFQDLKQAARQAAATEYEQTQARLAQQAAELNAQAAEVANRRTRLNDLARDLRARQLELEQQRTDQSLKNEHLRQRTEALQTWHAQQKKSLQERIDAIARKEVELAARLRQTEEDLGRQQAEIERRNAELSARAAKLDEAERVLVADRAELEQRLSRGAALADEVENQHGVLTDEWTRLARERAEIQAASLALEPERVALSQSQDEFTRGIEGLKAEREALRQKEADLERRVQAEEEQRQFLERQTAESRARQRTLEDAEAESRERLAELDARAGQLNEKAAALRAEAERLSGLQSELDVQRARVEESLKGAQELEENTRRWYEDALALPEAPARLPTAEAFPPAALVPWRTRATVLAVVVGVIAAVGWLTSHPPLQRATVPLQIAGAGPSDPEVLAEHRRRLLDPRLLDGGPAGELLAAVWRKTCAGDGVTVTTDGDQGVLHLSVIGRERSEMAQLAEAAGQAYERRVAAGQGDASATSAVPDLRARRDTVVAAMQTLREQRAGNDRALADLPPPAERDEATATTERLQGELNDVSATLNAKRSELAALLSADVPRGAVEPTSVDKALAGDTIYQEDRQEFRAIGLQYRTELSVSMLQLSDPIKVVQKALAQLMASLNEQRGLDPPADVGAVLEQCTADVSRAQGRFTPFLEQWQMWLGSAQNSNVRDDVVELVKLQNTVSDAARRLADEATGVVEELGRRIEALGAAADGGTRAVVVAAVIRGDHAGLKTATETFRSAASKTALSENFELDALDRKLRGLRMRLTNRQDAIGQQLQLEADRAARDRHAARVEEARDSVRGLDQQREEIVTQLVATTQKLRGLDDIARRRGELELVTRQQAAEAATLEARKVELDRQIVAAGGQWPTNERIEVGEPVTDAVAQGRAGGALLTGVGGFGATWLLCALVVGRIPRPRRVPVPPRRCFGRSSVGAAETCMAGECRTRSRSAKAVRILTEAGRSGRPQDRPRWKISAQHPDHGGGSRGDRARSGGRAGAQSVRARSDRYRRADLQCPADRRL